MQVCQKTASAGGLLYTERCDSIMKRVILGEGWDPLLGARLAGDHASMIKDAAEGAQSVTSTANIYVESQTG
jgi:hypothetical protein